LRISHAIFSSLTAATAARTGTILINIGNATRALPQLASTEVSEHFGIEADGSFMLDVMLIETEAA
jgi:hypothetical protein